MLKTLLLSSAIVGLSLGNVPFSKSTVKSRISDVTASASSQYADCYDYSNQGGDRLRAVDYIPYLADYNFDNRITSCCITGIWLLYADQNYNQNNLGASNYWVYGDNNCVNVPSAFDNKASSMRYTGAPDAWKADTLNLYLNEYFIGGEEYTYNDMPQLNYNDQAKSIIVTGCNGWTLYSEANYRGNCMCVQPSDSRNCYPGFYKTQSNLGSLAGRISSVRKGCYCGFKALPDNYESKEQQSFKL
eukprot:TRINITY_DN199_c0_g1_i2.p1 TRINITY_DN199_c0_g1~~TRINITY_DN199_c0_g1_i2.p1  ORF type:complete len:245 (-),score=39.72 TRINITY_DN199_c0_g1_i2:83-817(-)